MDFLQQLDQISDDEPDLISNQHKRYSSFQPSALGHNGLDFHGIKTVDVSADCSPEESLGTVNCHLTDASILSNITYHTNDSSKCHLIPKTVLSDRGRTAFSFQYFNSMQSKAFSQLYENDYNCVISSPTGSGKTVLFELAILRLLNTHKNVSNLKILYIAPTKALCLEREKDWLSKFSPFGLSVGLLTGDTGFLETDKVKKANIIITTPEKWDLMTRKWTDYSKLFEMIKILLIDEVHILKENRGSTLEVVVTRMKKICEHLRIIALSATVPNIEDVSGWIRLSSSSPLNAITLVFGEEYRPVVLQKVVYGFKQNANDFVFDSFLNSKLTEVLTRHSMDKPVIIFCPTRSSTVSTAKFLLKNYQNVNGVAPFTYNVKDRDLAELTKNGIAYHHAGISVEERNWIESGFKNGSIRILCSTSTLAVGVNLPAYLVIIKGTKMWNNMAFEEYSELDILQMMGRAGRPQFETEGKAVIMTSLERQSYYEALVKGNKKLESKLHLNLYENLASEVFLSTVTSLEDALVWLKHTFFYFRYKSNPTAYDEIPYINNTDMDGRLLHFCDSKLRDLINFKIIEVKNGSYKSTVYGSAMTKHYIAFDTMKMFIKCGTKQSVSDLLLMISKAKEFENTRLKRTEKKLFKIINNSPIMKYPVKNEKSKSIETSSEKIYLLIQYELGGLEYPNEPDLIKIQHSFKQDKFYAFRHVHRLLKCLIDCFVEKKDYISLKNCLYLYRSVNATGWEDCSISLRQLVNVGLAYVRKFANQNIYSFKQIEKLESTKLEYYLGLKPGQGNKIKSQVESLPKLAIDSKFVRVSKSKGSNEVSVQVKIDINVESIANRWNGKNLTVNVMSGLSTGELIDFRRSSISKISGSRSFVLNIPVTYKDSVFECTISCEEIGGIQDSSKIMLIDSIPLSVANLLKDLTKAKSDYLDTVKSSILFPSWLTNFYQSEDGSGTDNNNEEEDDDLDDLLVAASSKKTECESETSRVILKSGNLQCKHSCKDKTSYGMILMNPQDF